jgi:glycyl-tRNA synthetase (class II)
VLYCYLIQIPLISNSLNIQVLALKPIIAPVKCSVFPLTNDTAYTPFVTKIGNYNTANSMKARSLTSLGIANKVDESGATIGKR